jgi:hypothetical protein
LGYRHQNDKLKAYLQIRIGLASDIPKHQFVFTSQQTVNHMKNYLLALLLLYTCTCYSQSIKSTEITRKESVKFAESIGSFEHLKVDNYGQNFSKAQMDQGVLILPEPMRYHSAYLSAWLTTMMNQKANYIK